jgi:hypothetical protein
MEKCKDNMVNPSLSGTTRSHFKEWLKNEKMLIQFLGSFSLNVLTNFNTFSYLSIACLSVWLEAYFGKKL